MRAVDNSRQRGFSLAEVMVASAIMVIVIVGILLLYDRANKVFKTGNEAAELQQNVRVAYDRMVADIRMAGFDYMRGGPLLPGQSAAAWAPGRVYSSGTIVTPTTPNGRTYRALAGGTSGPTEPSWPGPGGQVVDNAATPPMTWQENGGAVWTQPDEQIEYAGATALTVRANYDYSANDPADVDNGREPNLESAQFPLVTTGNDEIVTYALVANSAQPGTAPNTDSVTFFADISVPRNAYPGGSAESQVSITGVDLTNQHPPYTLYRFTIANNGTIQRTALADNIRSLNFFYYEDQNGAKPLKDVTNTNLVPDAGGSGKYDPTVANSINSGNRVVRKKIRSIRVRLVGMSSVQDANYNDTSTANGQYSSTDTAGVPQFATDTVAPGYRRLTVDTLIAPRNLGLTGLAQTFLQPPPQPTLTDLCFGYCGIVVVSWNPNSTNPNATYVVEWDRAQNGQYSNSYDAGTSNTYAVDLTTQDLSAPFWFRVRALNAGGGVVSTNQLQASAQNATQPNPPLSSSATGGNGIPSLTGKVRVSWTAPTQPNSGSPSCTSGNAPPARSYLHEIRGYRIFRGNSANFNPSSSNMVADETTSGPSAPQTDGYGNYYWDDTNALGCGVTYFYRIETVEWCAATGTSNTTGNTATAVSPASTGVPGSIGTTGTPAVPTALTAAPLAPPQTTPPNSVCNSTTNVCDPINLMWTKVTSDVNGNPINIDQYEIERTKWLSGVQQGAAVYIPVTGALAVPGSSMTKADSAPMYETISHVNYEYRYRVRAVQTSPCPTGDFGNVAIFPPPCTFTGSVVVESGATTGSGTAADPWVMDAGDTLQVSPPPPPAAPVTFLFTALDIFDRAGNLIDHQTSANNGTTNRVLFSWRNNQTPGAVYTATFTITTNAIPQCTEQVVRYIEQQPALACSLTSYDNDSSILVGTAVTNQLRLDLKNTRSEALTIQSIDFEWNDPKHLAWNSTVFPSSGSVAGPAQASPYTMSLSPKPAALTTNDITIPAGGTRSLLLNFAVTVGNPSPITPSDFIGTGGNTAKICVSYTQPTQGSTVLHCRIMPNAASNNPGSCN